MNVHQERIQKVSANLCYCVPEFSNLDVAGLPDVDELLAALHAKFDGKRPDSLRQPFDRDHEEAKVNLSSN